MASNTGYTRWTPDPSGHAGSLDIAYPKGYMKCYRAGLNWKDHVVIDENLIRPAEINRLLGDASKAREKLRWSPNVSFEKLIAMVLESDLKKLKDFHYINEEYKRNQTILF